VATYHTKGIVIRRHNLGEADRIISFLTPEGGVIRAVAKGVRKIKSRMAGHLELFSEVDLMLAEGRNLDVVTSARLKHYGGNITGDLERLGLAYLMAEMIDRLSGEDSHHPGQYDLLRDALAHLDGATSKSSLLELWFKLRLLDRLGHKPELDGCVICGTQDPVLQYRFNVDLGGIVDEGCGAAGTLPMSHDQIKLWRLCLTNSYEAVSKVTAAEHLAEATLPVIDQFFEHTFGYRFKSNEILA
jgi:DNA repair protein RecO (recombination protein O)